MNKLIAFCGLDCGECDAYIATRDNNQALRERTARLWSELNNATILPEQINCQGCRMDGAKTVFCEQLCQIRHCAMGKSLDNCGGCDEMESCAKLGAVTAHRPDAMDRLRGGVREEEKRFIFGHGNRQMITLILVLVVMALLETNGIAPLHLVVFNFGVL